MPKENAQLFGPQHWNAIAKDIRIEMLLEQDNYANNQLNDLIVRAALTDLAIRFARRFYIDNTSFDPAKWLNQCSPDTDRLPLGELWDDN